MFKSGQGIPWGSFGIALFPVQDVTSQAGFHSVWSSNKLRFLRGSTLICMQQSIFLFLVRTKQFPPVGSVHKHVKKLRYVSVQVAFWPVQLQGAFVKGRLIFRLRGQVSHGLSSRWLEWGHDVVMGGGTATLCVCVCALKPLNNCCEGGETHQRPSYSVFPLSSRCRFTPPSPSAVESSKWQQWIDLLIHERDGLLQRAPGDERVEDHSRHHGERLWATCVAFRPLHLVSRLSQDGFMEHLVSVIQWHFSVSPIDTTASLHSLTLIGFVDAKWASSHESHVSNVPQ